MSLWPPRRPARKTVSSRSDVPEAEAAARARIAAAELDAARVTCRGTSRDYLPEYGDMDIALDPFPYPGGGTSCDALYMGVPLVTLRGTDHGGRFGASLLENLGLGELVAESVADYIDRAAALASDREMLAALRRVLRPMMQRSPLMDAAAYADGVMAAYERIWQRRLDTAAHEEF